MSAHRLHDAALVVIVIILGVITTAVIAIATVGVMNAGQDKVNSYCAERPDNRVVCG